MYLGVSFLFKNSVISGLLILRSESIYPLVGQVSPKLLTPHLGKGEECVTGSEVKRSCNYSSRFD